MKSLSKTHFPNTTHFPSLLLSDFTSLCTFIHSHPLYFAYLIFFFPYIRPLLSFLYPLLLSTSLLLLSLLATFPHQDNTPRNGFFVNAAKLVLDILHTSIERDDGDDYTKLGILEPLALELEASMEPMAITYSGSETNERRDEESLPRLTQAFAYNAGEEHVGMIDGDGKENYRVVGLESCRFGSMRREKEWKRTLACKLYEERQMVDGIEGMDLLWEVHEVDSGKFKVKNKEEKKKEKKGNLAAHRKEEEEEDEDIDGQLCCLQALRFSTAKMNLGMGRINSMRVSKAFKGMGLFMRRERKIP